MSNSRIRIPIVERSIVGEKIPMDNHANGAFIFFKWCMPFGDKGFRFLLNALMCVGGVRAATGTGS
jgi:hypothetical protein